MTRKKTTEEFALELAEKNPQVQLLSEYKSANEKVFVKCISCDYEWGARAANLLGSKDKKPSGCPECAGNRMLTMDEFKKRLKEINDTLVVTGDYKGNKSPVHVYCKICKHEWDATPNSLLLGHGCPKCADRRMGESRRKSHEVFKKQLHLINPNIELIGRYEKAQEKVDVRCLLCKHEWSANPVNLLNGSGCPRCHNTGTSYMEQFILASFRKLLGKSEVLERDKSAIGVELDVYIPSLSFAVEPGSWAAWHKTKEKADREKQDLCNRKGIRLITVYDQFDGKKPDNEFVIVYKKDLGSEYKHCQLKKLVLRLFLLAGLESVQFTSDQWREIASEAYCGCHNGLSEAEFVKRLADNNSTLELAGQYLGQSEPVLMRCKHCGSVAEHNPSSVLQGRGCSECRYERSANKLRLSNEEFVAKLKRLNPDVIPREAYKGVHIKIEVECKKCGHLWKAQPNNLYRGHGCPKCARAKQKRKKC